MAIDGAVYIFIIYLDYQEYLLLSPCYLLFFFDGSCFLTPGLPPHSEAGGSLVNVIVIVFGAVAYFTGRLY